MKILGVLTTIDSHDAARELASVMVERKLAACAQVSAIESFYTWEGATQHDPEFRVLFKTTATRYAELENAILELHSYDLPAITAFELTQVHEPYAEWVAENTK